MGMKQIWDGILQFGKKNGADILIGFGIVDMITGTILAVRATPEAVNRIQQKKEETKHKKLTTKETIDATWKCYVPAACAEILGTACILTGSHIKGQKLAALGTACSMAEGTLREYQGKMKELLGNKKEEEVRNSVIQDRIEKNPPPQELIRETVTGHGDTLFYDVMSGRYFYSDLESLKRAANKLSWHMNNGMENYISLNEWYMEIGIESIRIGDMIGWNSKRGVIEVATTHHKLPNGTFITGVLFEVMPEYDFDSY